MPRLIHLNGPTGVGKSTIAARYAAGHPKTLNLDADEIVRLIGGWREDFHGAVGLARVRAGTRQAWTWDQVRAIDLTTQGTDLMCTVRFDDEVIRFSGLDTENSLAIHDALGEHCLEALKQPATKERRRVGALTAITLAGAGGVAAALWTAMRTADPDGGTHFGLAMVAAAGFVTAVVTGIALIAVLRAPRPDQAQLS